MASLFTKIIQGEIPSYKIYEDDCVYVFLDINPMQKGHTLVVPKVEVEQLIDLDENMFDRVLHRARYVAQILHAKINCKRVVILVEGYNVPHAHIHLIPTNSEHDFDRSNVHVATQEELQEMCTLLTS